MNTPDQQEVVDRIKAANTPLAILQRADNKAGNAARWAKEHDESFTRAAKKFRLNASTVSRAFHLLFPGETHTRRQVRRG
jgi:hypothetical protein